MPTLWSYRSEDHEKPSMDKIIFIDTLTKTEKSNTTVTSTTPETTTVKVSVTEDSNILIRNVTDNATMTNEGNSSKNTSFFNNVHDIISRKHYYQLSNIIKKEVNSYNCTEKFERSSIPESCEDYVECKNGEATSFQCLDGLHFDPENADSEMPCQYACDVPCTHKPFISRYLPRECPHKFGYYKLGDKYNCSSFRICEFGVGYDFQCPNGLAFRSDNLRCDWPHKVPECDAEGYAGFQCPDKNESYQFYRSPTSCQVYYICIYGVPRRQVCPNFTGFDEDSRVCAPADRVHECDPHLKSAAKVDRRKQYLENRDKENYDDGDGYLANRNVDLSFARRVRKPIIISFPNYGKGFKTPTTGDRM